MIKIPQYILDIATDESMLLQKHLIELLTGVQLVVSKGIAGDIVELGCFKGRTSSALQNMLSELRSNKKLHIYDSFRGLPDRRSEDGTYRHSTKGALRVNKTWVARWLKYATKVSPIIHEGWFEDIQDKHLPNPIALAFLDGDLYDSIMISLELIYPRMSVGGHIYVHDYGMQPLPGVQLACSKFFKDKPEQLQDLDGLALYVKQ